MDQLLFVSQVAPYRDGPAGVHGVLEQAAIGVGQLAEMHGLEPVRVDDVRAIEEEEWTRTRVLALFTIGETPWTVRQRIEILDRLRSGAMAVIAIHSATDSCHAWDDYGTIVGARFDGHLCTQSFVAEVCVPDHPACAHLGAQWEWHDEVHRFRDLRPDATILLRVRDGDLAATAPVARVPPSGYPLAWCFAEGDGRVFSTSLGHFPSAWQSPSYLQHLSGGIRWALGDA